ncbi:hypothetical protein JYU34_021602 [Plutella xylostella]|uniref:Endonuclease-reverse transcriptase n=1 Tax=Plutella xylostella TaxID=51655 RepID=A0ABQ7PRK0_PLUXY|nr:hypothetical protein JYU34_021602 [Plutella xylostella]
MEEIMKMLSKIQEDLKIQKQEIKNMEENIKQSISQKLDKKFTAVEEKTYFLEKKIVEQESTIEQMDRQMRRKNLIFFGLKETERSYEELQNMVLEVINSTMKINCNVSEIEAVRRLGKRSDKIRPVILTLTTLGKKIELLKNKKQLDNSQIYIKQDFTKKVLQERQELKNELNRQIELGNRAAIRHGKIITLPNKERDAQTLNETQNRKKRNLPESPEKVESSDTETERKKEQNKNNNQPKKKNKVDIKTFLTTNQPTEH